jgi:DNA/RNA-binding domain of Phe-tRNA-synthetase-like protein
MHSESRPIVDAEIWQRYPDYRALSVVIRDFQLPEGPAILEIEPGQPAWMEGHLEAWRTAFRGFGANPKKTCCSVEALWKRVQKTGALPSVSPVVDIYNALSIRFGASFGGEDLDRYSGVPRLTIAHGDESFDTARDGEAVVEHPEPGEVIWRDDTGVTCRRWNWRQCRRTALTDASRNLWFVIDRLPPMPVESLQAAGDALIAALRGVSPQAEYSAQLLEPGA